MQDIENGKERRVDPMENIPEKDSHDHKFQEELQLFNFKQKQRELEMQREMNKLDYKIQNEERLFSQEYIYRSCCLQVDKRVLDYVCKLLVIVSVLIFCIYKLSVDDSNGPREVYFSLLSSIITLFINPPKIEGKQSAQQNNNNNSLPQMSSRRLSRPTRSYL